MQEKMKMKIFLGIGAGLILLFAFGVYNFMSSGPARIPEILQSQEGIDRVNKEAKALWDKHMFNLTNVKILDGSELESYPSIAALGENVSLYSISNLPAHIQVRTSKNRNVRFIFIFEPGTKPKWEKAKSTIEIDSNIFVLHSSGWKGE